MSYFLPHIANQGSGPIYYETGNGLSKKSWTAPSHRKRKTFIKNLKDFCYEPEISPLRDPGTYLPGYLPYLFL